MCKTLQVVLAATMLPVSVAFGADAFSSPATLVESILPEIGADETRRRSTKVFTPEALIEHTAKRNASVPAKTLQTRKSLLSKIFPTNTLDDDALRELLAGELAIEDMAGDVVGDSEVEAACRALLDDPAFSGIDITEEEIYTPVKLKLLWNRREVRRKVYEQIVGSKVIKNPDRYTEGSTNTTEAMKSRGKYLKWSPAKLQLDRNEGECLFSLDGGCVLTVGDYNLAALENAVYADSDLEAARSKLLWIALRKCFLAETVTDEEYSVSPQFWTAAQSIRLRPFYSAFDQIAEQETCPIDPETVHADLVSNAEKDHEVYVVMTSNLAESESVHAQLENSVAGGGISRPANSSKTRMSLLPPDIREKFEAVAAGQPVPIIHKPYGYITGYRDSSPRQVPAYSRNGKKIARRMVALRISGNTEALGMQVKKYWQEQKASLRVPDTVEVFCVLTNNRDDGFEQATNAPFATHGKTMVTSDLPATVQNATDYDALESTGGTVRIDMPYGSFLIGKRGKTRKGRMLDAKEAETEIVGRLVANRLLATQIPLSPSALLSENAVSHTARHGVLMERAEKKRDLSASQLMVSTESLRRKGVSSFRREFTLSSNAETNKAVARMLSIENQMISWVECLSADDWAQHQIDAIIHNL